MMKNSSQLQQLQKNGHQSNDRNIENELKLARKSQSKRKSEMMINQYHRHHPSKMMNKLEQCCCNNLQIFKYILIILAIIGSLFGSILLTIAGDPPYNQGAIYQYSDLMRLIIGMHQNLLDLQSMKRMNDHNNAKQSTPTTAAAFVPSSMMIEKRDTRTKLNEIFHFELLHDLARSGQENLKRFNENQFGRFLQQWLPMKHTDFQSQNPILDDANFYWNNYSTFQIAFITLLLLSNSMLLLTWIFFKILKNFQKSRYKQNRIVDDNKVVAADQLRMERKQFMNEQLENVRKFRHFRQTHVKHRMVLITLLFQLALIIILLCRPNIFVIVLHQVSFLLLSMGCLASTSISCSSSMVKSKSAIDGCGMTIDEKSPSINSGGSGIKIDGKIPTVSSGTTQIPDVSVQSPSMGKIPSSKHKKHRRQRSPPSRPVQSPLNERRVKNETIIGSNLQNHDDKYPDDKNPFEISMKNPIKIVKIKNPIEKLEIQSPINDISIPETSAVSIPNFNVENVEFPKISLIKNSDNVATIDTGTFDSLSTTNPIESPTLKDLLEVKLPKMDQINISLPNISATNPIIDISSSSSLGQSNPIDDNSIEIKSPKIKPLNISSSSDDKNPDMTIISIKNPFDDDHGDHDDRNHHHHHQHDHDNHFDDDDEINNDNNNMRRRLRHSSKQQQQQNQTNKLIESIVNEIDQDVEDDDDEEIEPICSVCSNVNSPTTTILSSRFY